MKAVILIGGLGTRLRPLTYTTPKSLLPIANLAFFERLVEWFGRHGVTELVLALSNLAAPILDFVDSLGDGHGLRIVSRVETSPLGSGGALKNCADLLDGTFILFNGDILTDLDLSALVAFHRASRAVVTATVNEVDDPSHYGILHLDAASRVLTWQEKPRREEALSRWGNVGAWVMEPEVLDHIPANRVVSIERDTFPLLLARGLPFCGFQFAGYWKDIGTVDKYVQANRDLLTGAIAGQRLLGREVSPEVWVAEGAEVDERAELEAPVAVGRGAKIGPGAIVRGPAAIGDGALVGEGARVSGSVLWAATRIGPEAVVVDSIVAGAEVGEGCEIGEGSVLAPGAEIAAGRILPPGTVLGPGSRLR